MGFDCISSCSLPLFLLINTNSRIKTKSKVVIKFLSFTMYNMSTSWQLHVKLC